MGNSNTNWKRTKFFIESKLHVPVLGRTAEVRVHPEDGSPELPALAQRNALDAFLAVGSDQRDGWTHRIALNCQEVCGEFEMDDEEPPVRLARRSDVWKHIKLKSIFVPQHGASADRYIFVHGDCAWEEEHGLELLFKNEQLFRVGPQEGLAQNEEWLLYFINE